MAAPRRMRRRRWIRRAAAIALLLGAVFAIWQFGPAAAERWWPTWHLRQLVDREPRLFGEQRPWMVKWANGVINRRLAANVANEQSAAAARQIRIESELRQKPSAEWAGFYATAPSMGVFVISIAPDSGFTLHSLGYAGSRFETHGDIVEVIGDRIRVRSVIDPRLSPLMIPTEFVIVRWDRWNCLVPTDKMLQFCNDANSGHSSPITWYSPIALEVGHFDETRPLTFAFVEGFGWGLPEVPPQVPVEFRSMVLQKPAKGVLTEVVGKRVEKLPTGTRIFFQVRVNVGSNDGVQPGMRFYCDKIKDTWGADVQTIASESCIIEIFEWRSGNVREIVPEIGWEFSTRHPFSTIPRTRPTAPR